MIRLSDLGQRICIIGPSNSGKSTLARALSKRLGIPVCHLDQLAHIPGTNWQPRANEEWQEGHDLFVEIATWVIEGNYSFSMPQRFKKATSIIWLDFNPWGCVRRYLLRSLKNDAGRPGRLANVNNDFNPELIRYILFVYPKKRAKTKSLIDQSGTRLLHLFSMKELNRYYRHWGL